MISKKVIMKMNFNEKNINFLLIYNFLKESLEVVFDIYVLMQTSTLWGK